MMLAGSIGGAFEKPKMDLTFQAQIWRGVSTRTPIGSPDDAYSKTGGAIPCDVIVLSDDTVMMQAGQTEVITHVLHFYENTDIRARDIVQIISNRRLGDATIPNFFWVWDVTQPTEDFGYMRARVRAGKEPTTTRSEIQQ